MNVGLVFGIHVFCVIIFELYFRLLSTPYQIATGTIISIK